jgi:hypothetical protein
MTAATHVSTQDEYTAAMRAQLGTRGYASPDEVARAAGAVDQLRRDGYVILRDWLAPADVSRVRNAVLPLLGPYGRNNFEGLRTQRLYGTLAKTRVCDALVEEPRILAIADQLLSPQYLLSQCQVIQIHPGEAAQPVHFDDALYPVPRPRAPLSVATIVALDDFTADNGATVIFPRSHTWGDKRPGSDDVAIPVVMPAGSVVMFAGTLWHGGGANQTAAPRLAVSVQYCQPWLRTQENMVLAVPRELVRTRSSVLQSLLGYSVHAPFMGMVDGQHPARLLREP